MQNEKLLKTEKRWLFTIIVIVLVLTTVPIIFGYKYTRNEEYYTGVRFLALADYMVYYSLLEQVQQGDWLFANLYTSEHEAGRTFNIFWLGAGLFKKALHLSSVTTLAILRFVLTPVLIISLYLFLRHYVRRLQRRRIIFLIMIFSSGLGVWFSGALRRSLYVQEGYVHWPMDLWVAEVNTFLTLMHSPHFIASLTLFLWVLFLFLRAQETDHYKYSFISGMLALILFQFHPYHAPTVYSVMGLFLVLQSILEKKLSWCKIKHGLIVVGISLPSVIYYVWLIFFDPYFASKAQQNLQLMTVWWMTLISYGFILPLAVVGVVMLVQRQKYRETKFLFLFAWFLAQGILIHLPIHFQRRLVEGWQIPMTILAGLGLFYLLAWLKSKFGKYYFYRIILRNHYLFIFIFVFFFSFSNVFNTVTDYSNYLWNHQPPFYLTLKKMAAIQWLKDNTPEETVILASSANGLVLPAWSGRTVFLGHGDETAFSNKKREMVLWFFGAASADYEVNYQNREEFLHQQGIQYVFWGPEEAAMGSFRPESEKYLELAYENGEAKIFRVIISQ